MSERLPGGFEMELERWRSIFDAMPEGVVLLLRDGTIVEANRATEYIVGKKREEILGEKCFVVVHGEKGHAEGCPLLRSLSTGVRERMEMEVDGKVFLVTCDPIRGKEGIIEGFVHIIRDVTEEKKMQKELEEKEALYKAIFEHTGTCMLLVEEDTTISLANEMAARYAGYPKEELQGRSWMEFVAEKEDLEKMKVYHALRRTDPQAVPQSYEFKVRNRYGEIFHALLTGGLIPGTKRSVISMQDITELKKTQKALLEAEERYRTIVENAIAPILVAQDGIIRFANRAALMASGYEGEELVGRPFLDFIHPDEKEEVAELHRRRLKGEDLPDSYSLRFIDKAGNIRWLEGRAVVIEWDGRPAILNFLKDITELKRAEEEKKALEARLLQAQKMEAIGRLAGGIAHDFNNILTVIKGHCQILSLDLRKDDPIRPKIEEIEAASDRAASLTRQLLAFSRRQIMQFTVFDLGETIRNMESMLRRLIGEDIELITLIPDKKLWIRADEGQLQQVIINLAVNARDAMPEGGRLLIALSEVELDEAFTRIYPFARPGPYVLLIVRDTGIGMAPEVRERIFEPFFTTKEVGKGTGLGLSTVYGIVKQSGGHILVESEEGKGTQFAIYLPRAGEHWENKEIEERGTQG